MKIGLLDLVWSDWTDVDYNKVRWAAELGFHSLGAKLTVPARTITDEMAEHVRKTYAEQNMPIMQVWGPYPCIISPDESIRKAGVEGARDLVKMAVKLGIRESGVRPTSLNPRGDWFPHRDNYKPETEARLVKSLVEILQTAEDNDVDIVLETHITTTLNSAQGIRRVIERTSGESLDTFTKQRLFGPAGMTASAFRDDAGLAPLGEAVGYIVSPSFAYQPMSQHWDLQGDAGLHTNGLDLLGWAGHVASGTVGGQTLLDAQRQAGPQPVPASVAPAGTAYAAGLFVSPYRGEQLLWHTGVFSNFRAAIGILPSSHIAAALVCNTSLAVPDALLISTLDAWLGYKT